MSFLNPFLLLGLIAVAIPLIIHLINLRRPDRVRFSTLVFFESLRQSTLQRIKIKQWLLLALRALAVLMLALALARPFLPSGFGGAVNLNQPGSVGIVIDNSPGMDQIDQYGPYIDQVKRMAAQIIENTANDDPVFIEVTNGGAMDLPALAKSAAQSRLEEIETVNAGNFTLSHMSGLTYRMSQASLPVKQLYLLTDGQNTQFSEFVRGQDEFSVQDLQVITVGSEPQPNTAITDIEIEGALLGSDQPVMLRVSVRNFGGDPVENQFLTLEYNDGMAGQHAFSLESGEEMEFLFEVVPGNTNQVDGTILLEGDELAFDNRRYFTIRLPDRRRILLIQQEGRSQGTYPSYLDPMIDAAVSSNDLLEVERGGWDPDPIDDPEGWDLIILDGPVSIPEYALESLAAYVQQGGGLFFLPASNGDLNSYNRLLERTNVGRFSSIRGEYASFRSIDRLAQLREGHPVLDEIFDKTDDEDLRVNPPEIFFYFQLEPTSGGGKYTVLNTVTEMPVLLEQQFGSGRMMVSAIGADPGWSNFPIKPLFAPLFYRTVLYLAATNEGGLNEHILGEEFVHQLEGNREEIYLEVDGQRIVPEIEVTNSGIRIRDQGGNWTPGWITVHNNGENEQLAINQHTMESDFATLSGQEIEELLGSHFNEVSARHIAGDESEVSEQLQTASFGREIWYWFVLIGILLLMTESVVSRSFKAESIQ